MFFGGEIGLVYTVFFMYEKYQKSGYVKQSIRIDRFTSVWLRAERALWWLPRSLGMRLCLHMHVCVHVCLTLCVNTIISYIHTMYKLLSSTCCPLSIGFHAFPVAHNCTF